ncbi:late competence development ComFB family protein [Sporosarcina sp. BP05]|uniref:late competence development ComFB family protein n=1 Tax=Sporosarcina sp. BP05 TaxID=2758726 RepID=UPI0016445B02|nr:late competence development ComFB family protein [Sporosarcina sp. BP05]
MALYNVMEEVVRDVLMQYKNQLQLTCQCERCFNDIMAIALNELPPRYIANEEYGPYVRASHEADRQGATNIILIVTKAAAFVSGSPRCPAMKPVTPAATV